jgi:3-hydroxyisobutyrate dehydrogenase-like beta-hydroxyacid dehydrogenase
MTENILDRKIGFVGLGRMGGGMATNLSKSAKNLTLYDLTPEKRNEFSKSCHVAADIDALLGEIDILCLSMPGSPEVEDVVGRFIKTDVAGKTVIDLSTSLPFSTKELHDKMRKAGGDFLDAPLSGGPKNATEGTLNVMVGGEQDVCDRHRPILETFAANIFYIGESGSGNIIKLATNFLAIVYNVLYAEILPLVEKLGVDPQILFDIVSVSGANSKMFQLFAPKMIDLKFPISFQLKLAAKDLNYLKKLYDNNGLPSTMLDASLELFEEAKSMGIMEGDTAELVRVVRKRYGMES